MNNPKKLSYKDIMFLEAAFKADETFGSPYIPSDNLRMLADNFRMEADVAVLRACTAAARVERIKESQNWLHLLIGSES